MWCQKCLTKLGNDTKYMQGNIKYMYSLEIVIVARSLRSLVKICTNLKTIRHVPKFEISLLHIE